MAKIKILIIIAISIVVIFAVFYIVFYYYHRDIYGCIKFIDKNGTLLSNGKIVLWDITTPNSSLPVTTDLYEKKVYKTDENGSICFTQHKNTLSYRNEIFIFYDRNGEIYKTATEVGKKLSFTEETRFNPYLLLEDLKNSSIANFNNIYDMPTHMTIDTKKQVRTPNLEITNGQFSKDGAVTRIPLKDNPILR